MNRKTKRSISLRQNKISNAQADKLRNETDMYTTSAKKFATNLQPKPMSLGI